MPTSILLSIKPSFAASIFSGVKRYEYRKVLHRHAEINRVVVYASSPIQKVIGEFEVGRVVSMAPDDLWSATKEGGGVSKEFFGAYFAGRSVGHAIEVRSVWEYPEAMELTALFPFGHPPQSFRYVTPPRTCAVEATSAFSLGSHDA